MTLSINYTQHNTAVNTAPVAYTTKILVPSEFES